MVLNVTHVFLSSDPGFWGGLGPQFQVWLELGYKVITRELEELLISCTDASLPSVTRQLYWSSQEGHPTAVRCQISPESFPWQGHLGSLPAPKGAWLSWGRATLHPKFI